MHPDLSLTAYRQHEREVVRDAELRRRARECPGCVVRARRRLLAAATLLGARLGRRAARVAPACCPA
ncbi:hypothetical protein [Cellulomonas sp. ES6]|uniref:hypothetical protein n=1 Tax=Cellulomonas sp. ES6 TaxID=3039384 RepID=UPI0019C61678|nr:hypothetical protein [Cellulomonas sp. ES6]MBD3778924.1 hypothetical protein [Micrococcales bacterium]WHP19270.1 hypothetical protein P9841_09350 [Cellulomonas sp. ES6]